MRGVEMYMIVTIVVTLMTATLGLPQTCLHYCNLSPDSSSPASIPPGCNCSLHNLRKSLIATPPDIKDTGIYYEPAKLDSSQNTWFDEQTLHMLNYNPISNSKENTFSSIKLKIHPMNVNTGESFAVQDSYDDNTSKSYNKYKRRDSYFPKTLEEIKELPLHLYLDIDINTSENDTSQLEELKNMFVNFQAVEKDLSECMNLHIYIFSKYIDTINKTNRNWGRIVEHDNLSSSQELTEIQSKCDQPVRIIKQSIYQIKQYFSREDQTTEIIKDGQETIYSDDSNKGIVGQNVTNEARYNVNTTTRSDMHTDALTTHPTEATDNVYSAETTEIVADKTDDEQFHKKYSEQDNLNLFKNDLSLMKNKDFTLAFYDDPTVLKKINLATTTDPTAIFSDSENLRTTSKTERVILSEEDMKLPRIITKELSNGTLKSVVDGYETIPNSDFINNNIITTTSDKSTISYTKDSLNESKSNPDLLKSNNDKIVQSNLVNIHGNLYFSFGKKQIPARFIQQSDGKLNVAIDGFSMCDQMLEDNASNFMNLLCKCIKHQNCI